MGSQLVRWGVELEGYNMEWNAVCNHVMQVTDDVAMVWDRQGANPLNWTVTHDGTIQGERPFELRTPAFTGEKGGFDSMRAVCKQLREAGAKVNASCGLHVHHEASYAMKVLGGDMVRLAITGHVVYAAMEKVLDSVMPASRRGAHNDMCHPCDSAALRDIRQQQQSLEQVLPQAHPYVYGVDGHHMKLNTADALNRHCTVEFRHHSGTLQASKVIPWVRLTGLIYERIVACALGEPLPMTFRNLKAMLEWVGAEQPLVDYWVVRQKHFEKLAEKVDDDTLEVADADYQGDKAPEYMAKTRVGASRPAYQDRQQRREPQRDRGAAPERQREPGLRMPSSTANIRTSLSDRLYASNPPQLRVGGEAPGEAQTIPDWYSNLFRTPQFTATATRLGLTLETMRQSINAQVALHFGLTRRWERYRDEGQQIHSGSALNQDLRRVEQQLLDFNVAFGPWAVPETDEEMQHLDSVRAQYVRSMDDAGARRIGLPSGHPDRPRYSRRAADFRGQLDRQEVVIGQARRRREVAAAAAALDVGHEVAAAVQPTAPPAESPEPEVFDFTISTTREGY